MNIILKLYRGDYPLPITYWFFGIMVFAAIRAIEVVYDHYYAETESLMLLVAASIFFYFAAAYSLLIFIATWRSAGKYKGPSIWPMLAKLSVVVGVIRFISEVALILGWPDNYLTQVAP